MLKNKGFTFVFVSLAMMILIACGSDSNANTNPEETLESGEVPETVPEHMAELYLDALEEGEVVFWSANEEEAIRGIAECFNETYPGIEVNHFVIQPGEAVQRYITEESSGNVTVDIINGSQRFWPPLIERDLVQQLDYKDYGVEETFFDDRLVSHYHLSYPLAYNTDLVGEDELPTTWDELLDPKWEGKIGVETRLGTLPVLSQEWGHEKTHEYLDQLLELDPVILRGGIPTGNAVASGEVAFAIGTYGFYIEQLKAEGAPIDSVHTDVIPVYNYLAGVLKDAPHPNAAMLFNIWMTSPEGLAAQEEFLGVGKLAGTEDLTELGQKWQEAGVEILLDEEENAEEIDKITQELTNKIGALE